MPETNFFYVRGDDGVDYGPVPLEELREWTRENRVGLGTSVRRDETGAMWAPWQSHPELVALLAGVSAAGGSTAPIGAPLFRRACAGVADLLLSLILVFPVMAVCFWLLLPAELIVQLLASWMRNPPGGVSPAMPLWFEVLANVICLGGPLLYYAAFHAAHGRTLAKSILQLEVVDAHGRKPSLPMAALRALVFIVSVFVFWGAPLLYIFFNPQRRALHDLVAGTYVVER